MCSHHVLFLLLSVSLISSLLLYYTVLRCTVLYCTARMPHGIKAIKTHLRTVDNVPLLVSLFTDATPSSVKQMVEVFREYGEVVLTIGGGYRAHNHDIYSASNVGDSCGVLPAAEGARLDQFPVFSPCSLTRSDVMLSFQLIGLTTINLLQTPYILTAGANKKHKHHQQHKNSHLHADAGNEETVENEHQQTNQFGVADINLSEVFNADPLVPQQQQEPLLPGLYTGEEERKKAVEVAEHIRLSVLLESIRKGRILLRNMLQALAFFCVSSVGVFFDVASRIIHHFVSSSCKLYTFCNIFFLCFPWYFLRRFMQVSLGLWPLLSLTTPMSIPPIPTPGMALLFQCVYVPTLCLALLQCGEPEGVMKNTPRKNAYFLRPNDAWRFAKYLAIRSGYVLFCIGVIGWVGAASTLGNRNDSILIR
jgi:hypothetical protein